LLIRNKFLSSFVALLLWLKIVSLALLKNKEKRRECFARKQMGGQPIF